MLLRFDEQISEKSSKIAVSKVYEYIEQNCSDYKEQKALKDKVDNVLLEYDTKL